MPKEQFPFPSEQNEPEENGVFGPKFPIEREKSIFNVLLDEEEFKRLRKERLNTLLQISEDPEAKAAFVNFPETNAKKFLVPKIPKDNAPKPIPPDVQKRFLAGIRIDEVKRNIEAVKPLLSTKEQYRRVVENDFFSAGGILSETIGVSGAEAFQTLAEAKRVHVIRTTYSQQMQDLFGVNVSDVFWLPTEASVPFPAVRDALVNYYQSNPEEFSRFPTKDPARNIMNSPVDVVIQAIAANPESGEAYLQMVDQHHLEQTQQKLKEIDKKREQGEVVRKKVVIVGAGPAAADLARQLGPTCELTVITREIALGYPNRARRNFLNSSSNLVDPNEIPLPLLEKSSTSPTQPQGSVDGVYFIPPGPSKTVVCDDGSTKTYELLSKLGEQVAFNMSLYVDDVYVGQDVLPEKVRVLDNGVELSFTDRFDGVERAIQADMVIFATGTPKESFTIGKKTSEGSRSIEIDAGSKKMYELSKRRLERLLTDIIRFKRDNQEKFEEECDLACAVIREKRAEGKIGYGFMTYLTENTNYFFMPRVLSREMFETLDTIWNVSGGPVRRPELNPLHEKYFVSSIGMIGKGDTVRANGAERFEEAALLTELIDLFGPENYPRPELVIYGKRGETPAELSEGERPRYKPRIDTKIKGVKERVTKVAKSKKRIVVFTDGLKNGEVVTKRYRHAAVFCGTGLEDYQISRMFRFSMMNKTTPDGSPIAKKNAEGNVIVTGTAAAFPNRDLSFPLQEILSELNIAQTEGAGNNSRSLWLCQYLTERTGWSLLDQLTETMVLNQEIPSHIAPLTRGQISQLVYQATGRF